MRSFIFLLLFVFIYTTLFAQSALQPTRPMTSSEIELGLNKLKVLGSAMYVAAHPDDENTAVLAWLSQRKMVRAAYLSLTHGSGGQNLLGAEKDSLLGILRTQELLAARSIDGAQQFFTEAADFGYTKSSEEALAIWNENKILAQMVNVFRTFRPDIILTRFGAEQGGHGHHTASAQLVHKAFKLAADSGYLADFDPWQPRRVYWNTWSPDAERDRSLITIDIGDYNSLLGLSYFELAARSRSMHKSQGFGTAPVRGTDPEYFTLTAGDTGKADLFSDIDLTWGRIPGGKKIVPIIDGIISRFDHSQPQASIPALFKLRAEIAALPDPFWVKIKSAEIDRLIQACAGLWVELTTPEYVYTAPSKMPVNALAVNRSDFPFRLIELEAQGAGIDTLLDQSMKNNIPVVFEHIAHIKASTDINSRFSAVNDLFTAKNHILSGTFIFAAGADTLRITSPIIQRTRDRIRGERFRAVKLAPPATLNFSTDVMYFADGQSRVLTGKIKAWRNNVNGKVVFSLPAGWRAEPAELKIDLKNKFEEKNITLRITPGPSGSAGNLGFTIESGDYTVPYSSYEIAYDHIPEQIVFLNGNIKVVRSDLKIIPGRIGYIMGSGDQIPECLSQIGYDVQLLSDYDLENGDLGEFMAIITGTRAYNARERLQYQKDHLMDYVYAGGTLITLHNTRFGYSFENIGPYPFEIGRARVSVENAPVQILAPQNPVFQFPNPVSTKDFDGWIQERGLYFAENWDPRYTPLMASHDPGETWQEGGNLYAQYGKGHYIYSGYSWFRQLPAGVPGAYRLFVNMISLGAKK